MHEMSFTDMALRSASEGAALAEKILELLDAGESVRIDFSAVEIMTPSFANTLVMTLMARYEVPELRSKCEFANRSDHIILVMNRAAKRFQRGIRLSSQRLAS